MRDSWTCLAVFKGPSMVSNELHKVLKRSACRLYQRKIDRHLFSFETCTGLITTSWTTHLVGTRSGVLFKAEIESEDGKWQVNFLLHEEDLKRGADRLTQREGEAGNETGIWSQLEERIPVDELYIFSDLSSRSMN